MSWFGAGDSSVIFQGTVAADGVSPLALHSGYGLLNLADKGNDAVGVFRIEGTNIAIVTANPVFSNFKDSAGTVNCYYEIDQFKVQNLSGADVYLVIAFFGV